jgi:plastocyanin
MNRHKHYAAAFSQFGHSSRKQTVVEAQLVQPRIKTRSPLSALAKLTTGALVGLGLALVYLQAVLLGGVEMPLPIFAALSVVLVGIIAIGWRWTPALGALWSVFLVVGNGQPMQYDLQHPEETHVFGFVLVVLVLAVLGVVGGVGATVQNYRRAADARHAPRSLPYVLAVIGALVVGAVLVAAVPRTGGAVTASPDVIAAAQTVGLEVFNKGEIRVKAGDLAALRIINPDAVGHSFDVDELNIHAPLASKGDGVALFKATPGTYTFYCAPHYNKATGEGMHGTLIVEP